MSETNVMSDHGGELAENADQCRRKSIFKSFLVKRVETLKRSSSIFVDPNEMTNLSFGRID